MAFTSRKEALREQQPFCPPHWKADLAVAEQLLVFFVQLSLSSNKVNVSGAGAKPFARMHSLKQPYTRQTLNTDRTPQQASVFVAAQLTFRKQSQSRYPSEMDKEMWS